VCIATLGKRIDPPGGVLREFGLELSGDVEIRVLGGMVRSRPERRGGISRRGQSVRATVIASRQNFCRNHGISFSRECLSVGLLS
jgi:hypothetical protein